MEVELIKEEKSSNPKFDHTKPAGNENPINITLEAGTRLSGGDPSELKILMKKGVAKPADSEAQKWFDEWKSSKPETSVKITPPKKSAAKPKPEN